MSFPPPPLFSQALAPNNRTGRAPYLNTRLNNSSSVISGASITTPTSPSPSSSKPRPKSKLQSRPKTHHVNTADSRSKSKAKAESRPKGSKLRMRVKRDVLIEAPDAAISDPPLQSERDTSAKDETVDEYPDGTPSTEDDETEGEAEAETDRDTEAEADTSVEADASHRTLTVDPFSAEEERIITVLSRKLEQLRESETTSTSPLSPVEAPLPPLSLPPSTQADSIAGVSVKPNDGGRPGAHSFGTSPLVVAALKDKQSQKRISPPPMTSTANAGTNYGGANNGYPPARVSSHSRTSSVDSGIYASSPSPAHSSPSSVYAAPVASPINYRSGSASANTNGEAKSSGHAVPIAVNGSVTNNGHTKGKGIHHEDEVPTDFNNTYSRAYGARISTLSSPEMSLSASPCETYDTRWMASKVNRNGIDFATAIGNGRTRLDGLQTSYEQEAESQTQTQLMLHALMQENDQLKSRIAEMEGNYLRLASLNEVYRVELIGYRSRLGLSVDNLIGLASDPLPESLPSTTRFPSTSTYTHTQNPHTYHHHHHPPSSPIFSNKHAFNSHISYHNYINTNSNGNNGYQYHHSATSSPSNSTNVLNPPSSGTTHGHGGSYAASRIPNGFGYGNGHDDITGNNISRNASTMSSTTATNGVPIPNRLKQPSMMTMPMSVPNTDNPLLYMHGSTTRSVNEPRTSASYSSPPYSNNSPALLSPSYASSYSAASSSAASSSAASSASASTDVTSPPSSLSFTMMMMLPPTFGVPSRGLSYPLVPPPSLSSSLGSGSGVWEAGGASGNLSPVEPSGPSVVSRRGSNAGMSVGRRGSLSSGGAAGSVGGRVMDTGSLRRSRGGSLTHISRPETVDETEGDHEDSTSLAGIREP